MPAHLGVVNGNDLSAPAGGYISEADTDQNIDVATVRDELGVTVVAKPHKMATETQTIKGKGDAALAAVAAGGFVQGTVKIISAKQDESATDFPDFEIQGKRYVDTIPAV